MHEPSERTAAEAEIKIRLTAEEYARMPAALAALGFAFAGDSALTDHYLDFAPSPIAKYNLTRLRVEDGRCLLTRKYWVRDADGQPVRLEEERAVTPDEAAALLAGAAPRTLRKRRQTYRGHVDGEAAEVVLDALTLDGHEQYFLECEVLVPPAHAAAARAAIRAWLRDHLPAHDLSEAPSMLELLLARDS